MTRFLRGLGSFLRSWKGSEERVPLGADEDVTRFVFRSEHLRGDGRAKPRAFMPELHPDTGEHELSICRLDGCADSRVWHLGKTCRRDVTLKARADFGVSAAHEQKLVGYRAPVKDFAEHAILVDWPPPDEKSHRISVAQALADASTVKKPPTGEQ